jgi:hypothetical protein
MCNQIHYRYLCGHIFHGPLIICEVTKSVMHQTYHINSFLSTLCEACSWTIFSSQILIPQLSLTSPPAAVRRPAYTESATAPPPYAPPSSINGILTPGMIPDSVPREIRYEVIGGQLRAIEHFKAEDIGNKRGYNNHHGWDDGRLCLMFSGTMK